MGYVDEAHKVLRWFCSSSRQYRYNYSKRKRVNINSSHNIYDDTNT